MIDPKKPQPNEEEISNLKAMEVNRWVSTFIQLAPGVHLHNTNRKADVTRMHGPLGSTELPAVTIRYKGRTATYSQFLAVGSRVQSFS